MNDISVKAVESPKDLAPVEVVEDKGVDKDPLAIDEDGKAKEEVKVEEAPAAKPADCDENAKEEADTHTHNGQNGTDVAEKLEEKEEKKEEPESNKADSTEDVSVVPNDIPRNAVVVGLIKTDVSEASEAQPETPVDKKPEPELEVVPVVEIKSQTPSPVPEVKPPSPKKPVKELVKEPSPSQVQVENKTEVTEVKFTETKAAEVKIVDVEMADVSKVEKALESSKVQPVEKIETKEAKSTMQTINGDISKEEQPSKRRASEDVDTESPLKKLCQEVEKTFPQHDSMINDYIQTATKNNIDEIQRHTEQLLAEIQTLRELAQKKEHEWNNILHLKKVKEEILLRLLRRKQVFAFEKSTEVNGSDRTDPFDYLNQAKNLAIDKSDEISGLSLKAPGSTMTPMIQPPIMPVTSHFNPMSGLPPPYDKAAHMQAMGKPVYPQQIMMPGPGLPGFPRDMNMNGQLPGSFGMPMGRQGPTKDVKSIIADYRQRNPDLTPRRGRRMKSILNPNMMNAPRPIAPKVENMGNLSLSNLNMLFNNLDMNQKAMLERLQQMQAGGIPNSLFKDALVQYASMQQANAAMMSQRPPETVTNSSSRQEEQPAGAPRGHAKERRRPPHEETPAPAHPAHPAHPAPPTPAPAPKERPVSGSPRLPPPPYPEISLLPVTQPQDAAHAQNSLLHGILTKAPSASQTPQSCSPTLAKLLTSPERRQGTNLPTFGQAKNCGEITITPVQPTPPPADPPQQEKPEEVVQLDDEESPASEGSAGSPAGSGSGSGSGRLVIDEAGAEESAPLCQGCRRRDAQFVCAGCANQWYCSRDCQVAAWDEHSEMCSG